MPGGYRSVVTAVGMYCVVGVAFDPMLVGADMQVPMDHVDALLEVMVTF